MAAVSPVAPVPAGQGSLPVPPVQMAPTSAPPAAATPRPNPIEDRGPVRRDSVRSARWIAHAGAKVLGDVDLGSGRVVGPLSVRGTINAEEFSSEADAEVFGRVEVQGALRLAGDSRLLAGLRCGELVVRGRLKVQGPVGVGRTARLDGRMETDADVTVQGVFAFDGTLRIPGTLRAGSIEGRLRSASAVGSILCDSIALRRPGGLGGSADRLQALRIEAREVHLESVQCEYVRAEKVFLGPGCHIARVDGTVVERHRSSYVGPEATFERPPGKFR
ncbi:MAG: hypothetical protein L3K19_00480 [Thermoplasmata archaeon]|nr:hypothetical protein [Thermoplasmata archaeon]